MTPLYLRLSQILTSSNVLAQTFFGKNSNKRFSRLARFVGYGAVLLSFGYIAQILYKEYDHILETKNIGAILTAIICSSIAYGVFSSFLCIAWHQLLGGNLSIDFKTAFRLYARAQIAKYLPGNIMHLVGRFVLPESSKIGRIRIASASFWEIVLFIISALLLSLLSWPHITPSYFEYSLSHQQSTILITLTPLGFLAVGRIIKSEKIEALGRALFFYLLFLGLSALCYGWISILLDPENVNFSQVITLTGCYAFSWFLGTITPGSPSGIGIREAILIGLTDPLLGSSNAMVAAIAIRLVTTAGDVFLYLFSFVGQASSSIPTDSK